MVSSVVDDRNIVEMRNNQQRLVLLRRRVHFEKPYNENEENLQYLKKKRNLFHQRRRKQKQQLMMTVQQDLVNIIVFQILLDPKVEPSVASVCESSFVTKTFIELVLRQNKTNSSIELSITPNNLHDTSTISDFTPHTVLLPIFQEAANKLLQRIYSGKVYDLYYDLLDEQDKDFLLPLTVNDRFKEAFSELLLQKPDTNTSSISAPAPVKTLLTGSDRNLTKSGSYDADGEESSVTRSSSSQSSPEKYLYCASRLLTAIGAPASRVRSTTRTNQNEATISEDNSTTIIHNSSRNLVATENNYIENNHQENNDITGQPRVSHDIATRTTAVANIQHSNFILGNVFSGLSRSCNKSLDEIYNLNANEKEDDNERQE